MFEPSTLSTTSIGKVEIVTRSSRVHQRNIETRRSQAQAGSDCEDLDSESDSDSSCTSSDSILRNSDPVTLN